MEDTLNLIDAVAQGDLVEIRRVYESGEITRDITAVLFSDAVREGHQDVAFFLAGYLGGICEVTWPAVRNAQKQGWAQVTERMQHVSGDAPSTLAL